MQATANARCRKIVVAPLARPTAKKRRNLKSDAFPSTECISKRAAPPASLVAGDKLIEADAIRQAQNGDEAMFEYLYRLHCQRVYAVCLRMVQDAADAEDLTQEAFLLVFRKIRSFRGESAFSTWLHRLVVNLVLMRIRRKSLPVVSIEGPDERDKASGAPGIDPGVPDLLMEGTLDRINLERCIEQLPLGYRKAFVLHDVQGYKHSEIAGKLECSVGGSKSQLHKARTRLRKQLHEPQRDKARTERLAPANLLSRAGEASLARIRTG
jgi:RNA polymerase sigma-70 factor (ECF subfamily)